MNGLLQHPFIPQIETCTKSKLFKIKFHFGYEILYLKSKPPCPAHFCIKHLKLRFGFLFTVKSQFNEWTPSAPFHALNRDFTLN